MSSQECIHGFEIELCDLCSPRRAPEPARPARRAPQERPPRAPGASTRRPASAGPRVSRGPVVDPAQHRVFHVTHRDTLEWILDTGVLTAGAEPPVDLSTPLIRELRATAPAGEDRDGADLSVADCVAFALSDQASWWRDLREGALDRTRWSDAARATRPTDLVVLVARLGDLPSAVVTDADAASTVARLARTPEEITRTVARVRSGTGALEGEALVPGEVPFDAIVLIGVANEPARDRVREMLAAAGHGNVRVLLSPEWFSTPQLSG